MKKLIFVKTWGIFGKKYVKNIAKISKSLYNNDY